MNIDVHSSGFSAALSGIDVTGTVDDHTIKEIRAALDRHGVIVLREQWLSDEQQLAFSERFGLVERFATGRRNRLGVPGLTDVSNINEDDAIFARDDERHLFSLANQLWHTDSSFKPIPACYSMLSCREAATRGGDTEFADMRAAYAALSDDTKALIGDLVAEHAFIHSRRVLGFVETEAPSVAAMPPVLRPLVHQHAGSGQMSLYLASHALRIIGWPVPEGRLLLMELTEHATQPAFIYRHQWASGDFVLWDNRSTMHRGLRYAAGQRRDLRRTTTRDDVNSKLIVEARETAGV